MAGEDVESQRSGWGLGQYLYQLAKDYIAKHFPDAKFITGEVHSNTALKSRKIVTEIIYILLIAYCLFAYCQLPIC